MLKLCPAADAHGTTQGGNTDTGLCAERLLLIKVMQYILTDPTSKILDTTANDTKSTVQPAVYKLQLRA